MTLQLISSEFPYIYEENLVFFFISVVTNLEAPKVDPDDGESFLLYERGQLLQLPTGLNCLPFMYRSSQNISMEKKWKFYRSFIRLLNKTLKKLQKNVPIPGKIK
jgi:hypothetical protein